MNTIEFEFQNPIPADQTKLDLALKDIEEVSQHIDDKQPFDPNVVIRGIYEITSMGRGTDSESLRAWRIIGKDETIKNAVETRIRNYDAGNLSTEVLETIRVGYLMGYTKRPLLESLRRKVAGFKPEPTKKDEYGQLFEKHFQIIEDKRKEEEAKKEAERLAKEAAEAKKADKQNRLKETSWRTPESSVGKSQEWVDTQKQALNRWNQWLRDGVIKTDKSPGATLKRFEMMMDLLHAEISSPETIAVTIRRCRAMAEVLYQKVWAAPDFFEKFFQDQQLKKFKRQKPAKVNELSSIARALYVPHLKRGLGETDLVSISKDTQRIYKRLFLTFHTDRHDPEIDHDLSEYASPFMEVISKVIGETKYWK